MWHLESCSVDRSVDSNTEAWAGNQLLVKCLVFLAVVCLRHMWIYIFIPAHSPATLPTLPEDKKHCLIGLGSSKDKTSITAQLSVA